MNNGKKITIYLATGIPKGVREVKIDQWSGKAICGPRNGLSELLSLTDVESAVCLYFLIGPSDQGGLLDVYIGEADGFKERIKNHDYKKDWWEDVVVFISQDRSLTKTGIQYLESICVERLGKAGKCNLKNGNIPSTPSLPKEDMSGLEIFYENISTIMPILGYDIFIKIQTTEKKQKKYPAFFCTNGGTEPAEGEILEDGKMKVLKNSKARMEETESFQTHPYKKLRSELIKIGRLVKDNTDYYFTDDYVFNSPSAAAAIIKGRSVSGSKEWRTRDGKTLEELVEAGLKN